MKRVRLRLKNFSETPALGRFRSRVTELVGFDLEEVRPLRSGDRPASSSFDPLRSVLYKRYHVRVRRAERSARILFALDDSPSVSAGPSSRTKRSAMFRIVEELAEGFSSEGANEIGFLVWSSAVEEYFPPTSGSQKAREWLADLASRPPLSPPTKPTTLFEYLLAMPSRASITFVFSDWHDTDCFREALKQCLAAGQDIVPIVMTDSRETRMPWFLGDVLLQSVESKTQCFAGRIKAEVFVQETFRALNLPFITVDADGSEEEWDKAFDEFFAIRERERR